MMHNPHEFPGGLPIPEDDGACDHLLGSSVPRLHLVSTDGGMRDIGDLANGPAVVYVYPSTGVPGVEMPEGWDQIPGARGCTPQSCGYRDDDAAFEALGVEVFGLGVQNSDVQREFVEREHIPFALLSDPDMSLGRAVGLPTFEAGGRALYKRVTIIVDAGTIVYVRYPVFPPDGDAAVTLGWLRALRT